MKSIKIFCTSLFFPILLSVKKRQPKIKAKIQEVTQNYQSLINEFELIQKKESKLSKSERDEVVQRVIFLVLKGHITVD